MINLSSFSEMTKHVRKAHPQDWLLRHNIERKVRNKLSSLPGSSLPRRRIKQSASEFLNQSAGVVFVALFVMFCVTIFVTILSFVLWYLLEQFSESLWDIANSIVNFRDVIWDVILAHIFEGRISPGASKAFIEALTNLSVSLSVYNGSTISQR